MKIKATLIVLNSAMDRNGNTYWAFQFIDHRTGFQVVADLGGSARGNAEFIRYGYDKPREWSDSIQVINRELPYRDFKALTKDYPYAHASVSNGGLTRWVKAGIRSQDSAKRKADKLARSMSV